MRKTSKYRSFADYENALFDHLMSRSRKQSKGDCLIWTGGRSDKGYGIQQVEPGWINKSGVVPVHRLMYVLQHTMLEATDEVDHLCRNKLCLNIDHMILRSKSEHATISNKDRWEGTRSRRRPWLEDVDS